MRVSNRRAQKLYEKYAFQTVDIKRRYYRNNGEDAYDMRMDILNSSTCSQFEAQYNTLFKRHQLADEFSPYPPPHN